MLLERNNNSLGRYENGTPFANVCGSCTPALSLANGLWIGDVPPLLNILTLPEQILIARYFPAAYIVKLYPKKRERVTGHQQVCRVDYEGTSLRIV
ncbi:hypothetical protein EDB92DRAFT_1831586 [Lactarius akahatsu]|uniref:DUF6570 domain-containing protein n=1 Tax=Lactarius akahatsu TaxID=416441 RepID=A0AAD4LR85_9AGAM|nr:hypothetical protein EDB92DRAFT_1831586 [Lactarius akahatsu]